jgi:predicted cupin superfamily sugar epimerase
LHNVYSIPHFFLFAKKGTHPESLMNVQKLIDRYKLIPHPEGGYYREAYRSEQILYSPAAGKKRRALTHIYFLLPAGQVSRFHKVIHDEVWNFYAGAPLKLKLIENYPVYRRLL